MVVASPLVVPAELEKGGGIECRHAVEGPAHARERPGTTVIRGFPEFRLPEGAPGAARAVAEQIEFPVDGHDAQALSAPATGVVPGLEDVVGAVIVLVALDAGDAQRGAGPVHGPKTLAIPPGGILVPVVGPGDRPVVAFRGLRAIAGGHVLQGRHVDPDGLYQVARRVIGTGHRMHHAHDEAEGERESTDPSGPFVSGRLRHRCGFHCHAFHQSR